MTDSILPPASPEALAILPLRNSVLFPASVVPVNVGRPRSVRLIEEALEPLSRNQPARFKRTDWENKGREQWREIEPAEFVILEGVSASREAFQPFLTCSIWVETPQELRLRRGLERDGEEARAQWEEWMAQEDAYVRRERPQNRANMVVLGGHHGDPARD
jgi:hypothetical protein